MVLSNTKQPYLPEVAAALAQAPDVAVWETDEDIRQSRTAIAALFEADRDAILSNPDFHVEEKLIPGPLGDIAISIISPKIRGTKGLRPGIFHIHGGAMVVGDRFLGIKLLSRFITELDAVIVTVEYRLAPEHKGMALVEDCFAALKWFGDHLKEFDVNPRCLLVAGASAGGGLAAGTVLLARDRNGPELCGQMLLCPMLDDRNETVSIAQYDRERGTYCGAQNKIAWRCVLGDQVGKEDVSMYTAPARAVDLSGLPPAYVDVGGAEPFRDEAIAYALKLSQCGVVTDFHLWGGGNHGFERTAPEASASKSSAQVRANWLHNLFSKQ
ncbi:hypothetical protein CDV31_013199 [Fusarium ambrosium]|uniref:Alpha/beta hydrolase fold-3 domain-containing protein n=1 Tax=Fusarium ambrosium TaxID=131363 RepID=A0A428T535_9HYPO|nr:hypothetical protein CDV31_013199 [Fusarium ambrosium]